jgi:hypothetical protein
MAAEVWQRGWILEHLTRLRDLCVFCGLCGTNGARRVTDGTPRAEQIKPRTEAPPVAARWRERDMPIREIH